LLLRYDNRMKTPPDSPEFERFTDALKNILSVKKADIQAELKGKPKSSVGPGPVSSSNAAR